MTRTALIVGAGSGISASFARLLAKDGYRVALASRVGRARCDLLLRRGQASLLGADQLDHRPLVAVLAAASAELLMPDA